MGFLSFSGGACLGCARCVGSSAFHGSQVGDGGFQGAEGWLRMDGDGWIEMGTSVFFEWEMGLEG